MTDARKSAGSIHSDPGGEGELLHDELCAVFAQSAKSAQQSLVVAAPFITRRALRAVLRDVTACSVVVLTTWKTNDVLLGASDTGIYPFLRRRGWVLRIHPRLHAKLVIADLHHAIVSTANVTELGLGLASNPNVECAVKLDQLSTADQCWILNLVFESTHVTDAYYSAFRRHLSSLEKPTTNDTAEFDASAFDRHDSAQAIALPASESPTWLIARLKMLHNFGISSLDPETLRKVLHDVSLFSIRASTAPTENMRLLRERYFALPAIIKLERFLTEGRYFGEIKAWLQEWTNGQTITHPQLTRLVQILLAWFVELGQGGYVLKRPRHSQFLMPSRPVTITGISP